jgi:hypothetical protein
LRRNPIPIELRSETAGSGVERESDVPGVSSGLPARKFIH